MAAKRKRKRVLVPVKFDASILKNPQFLNALLIVAVLVPIVSTLVFWSQEGFKTPMSKAVFDKVAGSPVVFPVFLVLVAASFWLQYRNLPTENKQKMLGKTPTLIFLGLGVAVFSLVLIWWQDPAASARTIISQFARSVFVSGSVVALTLGSVILIFLVLSKEEQQRFVRAVMLPFSALLMLAGPTYVILFLQKLNIPYVVLVPVGFASFTAGLILFLRLIKEEVKP